MLHPSYNELMDYVNENAAPQENGEPLVQSRYTLVMAAAKRARQIVDARAKVQTSYTAADKPLSVAVKELYSGEVRILGENEEPDAVLEAAVAAEEANAESGEEEAVDETAEAKEEAAAAEGTEKEYMSENDEADFTEGSAEDVLEQVTEDVSEETMEDAAPENEAAPENAGE